MTTAEGFLQQLMAENGVLANQAEQMRLVVATVNLILASSFQVALAFLGLERQALPLTLWLVLIGIYGYFALIKLYERETYHRSRVRALRTQLDRLCPEAGVSQIFQEIEQHQKQRYPRFFFLRLNVIWSTSQIVIGAIGVIESLLCILRTL